MLGLLKQFDYFLFSMINFHWNNPVFDFLLPMFRNKYFWSPFYVFLIVFMIINFKKKGLLIILFIIVTVFITDQLSSAVIKPIFHRLRPCNDMNLVEHIRVLAGCSGSYSFPSSHATNHFAVAFFLINLFYSRFRWTGPVLFLWALSVAYAQVYVGLHFPIDIIGGGIIGGFIGFYMAKLSKRWVGFDISLPDKSGKKVMSNE